MPRNAEKYFSEPEGMIPNSRFPLLIYRSAVVDGGAKAIKDCFLSNGWSNNWDYPGVYEYAHFHSPTHERLGCAEGWMEFNLSVGENGWTKLWIEKGDVIVVPAGVSHEMISKSENIHICGGYPDGRDWDDVQEEFLNENDYKQMCKRIMMLPIPNKDPVTGCIMTDWHKAPSLVDAGWNAWRATLDKNF